MRVLHRRYNTPSFIYLVLAALFLMTIPLGGEGYLFDWNLRGNATSSLCSTYSHLWTLFFYVPTWIGYVLMTLFVGLNLRLTTVGLLWIGPVGCYLIDMVAVWPAAATTELLDLTNPQLNLLLLNSLNRYHPLVLYAALVLYAIGAYFHSKWVHRSAMGAGFGTRDRRYQQLLTWLLSTTFVALYGGSWWALQEGTWGGWWNWDPSEVLGLFVLLPTLLATHESLHPMLAAKSSVRSVLTMLTLVGAYFVMQLTFESVSHNFGVQLFFFFQNTTFLHVTLVGLVGLLLVATYRAHVVNALLWFNLHHPLAVRPKPFSGALQRLTVLLYVSTAAVVMGGTAVTALLPWLRWGGFDPANLFLKANVALMFLFMFFQNPTLNGRRGSWVLLSGLLTWQSLPHWRYLTGTSVLHGVLHATFLLFFTLNTWLFDTPMTTWTFGSAREFVTPNYAVRLEGIGWALEADTVVRFETTLGTNVQTWLGADSVYFQANTGQPTHYLLTCSNETQANWYALTDYTRLALIEVETAPLLTSAVPLLGVVVYRHSKQ